MTLINGVLKNPMRWLRVLMGLLIGYEAVVQKDFAIGAIAAVLLLQGFTNTGCGGGSCTVNKE